MSRIARSGGSLSDGQLALHAMVGASVVVAVVASALAVWHARAVLLLLFLAYTLAAAMRPTVDALVRLRVPRSLAIGAHVAAVAGLVALVLWLVVPVALEQTQRALEDVPASSSKIANEPTLTALKHNVLLSLERHLRDLPSPEAAFTAAVQTLGVLAAVAFTLACAVYWLSERDRFVDAVLEVVPRRKRRTVRDAWLLVDLRLGAVIRTKLLLVVMVGTTLSFLFWLIGVPYFLVVGALAGLVEIVPVIGPLIAGLAAVAAGLTVSWQTALAAAAAVYGIRILQDYIVNPRLFGRAVDLPPLAVLLAVSAVALLLGPFWVPLAIPITAVLSTVVDVLLRDVDPAGEPVPSVLVPTDDTVESRRNGRAGRLEGARRG